MKLATIYNKDDMIING